MLVINFANHMKVVVFYISLIFLLFCGGNYLWEYNHHSPTNFGFTQSLDKKQQLNNRNLNQHNLLIESDGVDLDEESHTSEELNDGTKNKYISGKQSLLNSWYLAYFSAEVFKNYYKGIKIFRLFFGQSNPIYITLSVLRI